MQVYIVKKNADFTEGRGPMLLHKIFLHEEDAVKYCSGMYGIYGSQQYTEEEAKNNSLGYAYLFNGYQIEKVEVEEKLSEADLAQIEIYLERSRTALEKKLQKEKDDLTNKIKSLEEQLKNLNSQ